MFSDQRARNHSLAGVALVGVAAGVIGAVLAARRRDAVIDTAVLGRLERTPDSSPADLASELGLRPAALRLSLRRLSAHGRIAGRTGAVAQ